MRQFTCLPKQVSHWLQVLRPMFHHRHHLVFCWLLVCQAVDQEQATGKGLARLAPRHIAEWHLRRVLTATYWNARIFAVVVCPPSDRHPATTRGWGVLGGGGQYAERSNWPAASVGQEGAPERKAPYVFGLHIGVVMLQWGHDRIPVDFEIVRRKDDPQ